MLAPSFAGCRLFLLCRNLLACSSFQNTIFDVINLHRMVRKLRHIWHTKPSDHKVVRAKQQMQNCIQNNATNTQYQQQTMVPKRERRYNIEYPNDIAAAVLVSNETRWYMLPIKLIITTALHGKMLASSLAHPDCAFFRVQRQHKNN